MDILTLELPPIATNAYLISDTRLGQAILIDAPQGAWEAVEPILKEQKLELQGLLLTHAHFDHVLDAELFNKAGVPVYLHVQEKPVIGMLGEQLKYFDIDEEVQEVVIDNWLEDGAHLEFLGQDIEVRRVSGHSPGNLVFYFPAQKCAFAGDAIFNGSVGKTNLPGGNFKVLETDIRSQIYTLPNDTIIYPGHGESTSVGKERASNPYVRG